MIVHKISARQLYGQYKNTHLINTKYMKYQKMFPLFNLLIYSYTLLLQNFFCLYHSQKQSHKTLDILTHTHLHIRSCFTCTSSIILTCILHEYIKRKVPRMPTFIVGGMDAKYGDNSAPLWFCLQLIKIPISFWWFNGCYCTSPLTVVALLLSHW